MDDDLRILVLGKEDSPGDLIEYELSKSNLQFTTLRVTSREAFLQALQESSPNLILVTDRHDGEIGSKTALALAQEFCPGTPCFLISGSSPQEQFKSLARGMPGSHLKTAIASFFAATCITQSVWEKPEVLFKSQDALQTLLHAGGVPIAFLSPYGQILEFNSVAERITGWLRHEILGKDGVELIFPEAYQPSATAHLQRVLTGKSAESIDLPLKLRQGTTLSYRWYCNLISDSLGQPAGIIMVGQLLSDSKLGERLPRARLVRSCSSPAGNKSRRLFTRRTGTC